MKKEAERIITVSGGIDSSVALVLTAKALGVENVVILQLQGWC